MNLQRKLTLMVTTAGIAFGAGHYVQKRAEVRLATDDGPVTVSSLVPVAAGPEALAAPMPEFKPPLPAEAAPIVPAETASATPATTAPIVEDAATKEAEAAPPAVLAAAEPEDAIPNTALSSTVPPVAALADPAPAIAPLDAAPVAAPSVTAVAEPMPAPNCDIQLELVTQPGAMIGITLLAPCNPAERVVLWHDGLAVTGKTSATGSLFTSLPAFEERAIVEVRLKSGDRHSQSIDVPEAREIKRFAVQWQDADAFQLHAFVGGAGYNQVGHYSAAFTGKPEDGTFVSVLGDASTELPLLAEVFTFGSNTSAEVVVEASISTETCGRTIFGEMIAVEEGSLEIQDLTLAMPECDGIGDILVLKNLMQDMKLAAAD